MAMHDTHSPYGAVVYESGVAKARRRRHHRRAGRRSPRPPAHVGGNVVTVLADGSGGSTTTSALTGDDLFVVTPTNAAGRWLRKVGTVDLKMAIASGTADAAVLATVPARARFLLRRGCWEITADFTGGNSSAIGASSNGTGYTTKGDLHGGSSGDVAASLTAGVRAGTIGADVAAGVLLVAGDTVHFDRITSAFTAGSGFLHLVGELVANAGS